MLWLTPCTRDANVVDAQVREKQKAELRIAERLRGGDEMVEKLFWCLREGMVKRRKIATRLGVSVEEVTNCRKRLNRKLGEMARTDAGVPRWVPAARQARRGLVLRHVSAGGFAAPGGVARVETAASGEATRAGG
jgi:hypothetical protein